MRKPDRTWGHDLDRGTWEETFPDSAALIKAVDTAGEFFNHIISWQLYPADEDGHAEFHVHILMPRKGQTLAWRTDKVDEQQVRDWIAHTAIPRTLRWYGLEGASDE